mgnify:CR=1 FL=1
MPCMFCGQGVQFLTILHLRDFGLLPSDSTGFENNIRIMCFQGIVIKSEGKRRYFLLMQCM